VAFDGVGAHIKIPTSASFDSCAKQITLAAWVYRKSVLPESRVVIGRQQGSGWNDQWTLAFSNDGGAFCVGSGKIVKTVGLPVQQWMHYAATFDGTELSIYVNGAGVSGHKLNARADLVVEPKPVTIGAGMNFAGDEVNEHFQGVIDEVRIYNRALSAAEISALARSGKP
jgi:concanavalin A-like lectin/glucanase superfamily protein